MLPPTGVDCRPVGGLRHFLLSQYPPHDAQRICDMSYDCHWCLSMHHDRRRPRWFGEFHHFQLTLWFSHRSLSLLVWGMPPPWAGGPRSGPLAMQGCLPAWDTLQSYISYFLKSLWKLMMPAESATESKQLFCGCKNSPRSCPRPLTLVESIP